MKSSRISLQFIPLLMLAGFYACFIPYSECQVKQDGSSLSSKIDKILNDSLLEPSFIGVDIVSVENLQTIYSLNSNKLFHPASNLKLITSAAALHLLGEDFFYRTYISTNGGITDGVLNGSIYIKASGDPLITADDIDSLGANIEAFKIRKITGDLVCDAGYFDTVYWGRGWMWDDEPSSDQPFITPLCLDGNSIRLHLVSGPHERDPLAITIDPVTTYIDIINNGITSAGNLIPELSVTRQAITNRILIKGSLPGNTVKDFRLSVWKPEMYFLHLFRERLRRRGIIVEGSLRIDSMTALNPISQIIHPIDTVLRRMNKMSDNLAAENLLKTLSAEMHGKPGSATDGVLLIKEYLFSLGIDTSRTNIFDGSGVSWYNEISPSVIVKVLLQQHKAQGTFKLFYESLPIASVDGTLKYRMINTRAANNLRAKTGTLTGVSGISGYLSSRNGKLVAFSILCNHFPKEIMFLRDAQDRILELIADSDI